MGRSFRHRHRSGSPWHTHRKTGGRSSIYFSYASPLCNSDLSGNLRVSLATEANSRQRVLMISPYPFAFSAWKLGAEFTSDPKYIYIHQLFKNAIDVCTPVHSNHCTGSGRNQVVQLQVSQDGHVDCFSYDDIAFFTSTTFVTGDRDHT